MRRAGLVLALVLVVPPLASAQQVFESVGTRALGMAGAFVAVANDPSAVHWNPAGLAMGGPAGATIEWAGFRTGNPSGPPTPGPTHRTSKFVSLGTWPMGLSYAHFQSAGLVASPDGTTTAESLQTNHVGVTILQSIVRGVVVGSTLKYVRGTTVSQAAQGGSAGDALDHVAAANGGRTTGRFDYDVGVIVDMERVRLGFTTRNLRSPTFPDVAGRSVQLKRRSRIGVAVLPINGVTLAMDVDLDTVDLRDGLRRMIAFGGEERLGSRFAVREGVRWSLMGPRRQVVAAGASIALRPKYWLDGYYTRGHVDADRGFGLALRAGF